MIPSPNMTWLTGQTKILMERPTTLLYRPGKKAALIIAGFEIDAAPEMDIPVEIFPFSDDPSEWGEAFRKAGEYLGLAGKKIAAEPIHFRISIHQKRHSGLRNLRRTAAFHRTACAQIRRRA